MSSHKKVRFSLDQFHKHMDEDAVEKMTSQLQVMQFDRDRERDTLRGYKTPVMMQMPALYKARMLPKHTPLVTFEFAVLALHNISGFDSLSTVAEFTSVFDEFFFTYVYAANNFKEDLVACSTHQDLQRWVKDYGKARTHLKRWERTSDECWRFLIDVSAQACLRSVSTNANVLNWVTITPDGKLLWHITADFLKTYRHLTYTYYKQDE